jgi:hypothetical protein
VELARAAALTGQPISRLRGWCAIGALCCERDERGWRVPASEMPQLRSLIEQDGHPPEGSEAIALAVPLEASKGLDAADVARRTEIEEQDVSFAPLAVDGEDYEVISWPQMGDAGSAEVLAAMADEFDGLVLTRTEAARL